MYHSDFYVCILMCCFTTLRWEIAILFSFLPCSNSINKSLVWHHCWWSRAFPVSDQGRQKLLTNAHKAFLGAEEYICSLKLAGTQSFSPLVVDFWWDKEFLIPAPAEEVQSSECLHDKVLGERNSQNHSADFFLFKRWRKVSLRQNSSGISTKFGCLSSTKCASSTTLVKQI